MQKLHQQWRDRLYLFDAWQSRPSDLGPRRPAPWDSLFHNANVLDSIDLEVAVAVGQAPEPAPRRHSARHFSIGAPIRLPYSVQLPS
jgi:hypothetical protein